MWKAAASVAIDDLIPEVPNDVAVSEDINFITHSAEVEWFELRLSKAVRFKEIEKIVVYNRGYWYDRFDLALLSFYAGGILYKTDRFVYAMYEPTREVALWQPEEGEMDVNIIFYLTQTLSANPLITKIRVMHNEPFGYIHFREFKLWSHGQNIALQGTATASSAFAGFTDPSVAIDGITTETDDFLASFSTNPSPSEYWQLELAKAVRYQDIDSIEIFNRATTEQEYIDRFDYALIQLWSHSSLFRTVKPAYTFTNKDKAVWQRRNFKPPILGHPYPVRKWLFSFFKESKEANNPAADPITSIRLSINGDFIKIYEMLIYTGFSTHSTNIAPDGSASASSLNAGGSQDANVGIDGDLFETNGPGETDALVHTERSAYEWFQVNLAVPTILGFISKVEVVNRHGGRNGYGQGVFGILLESGINSQNSAGIRSSNEDWVVDQYEW